MIMNISKALLLVLAVVATTVDGHSEFRVGRSAANAKLPKPLSDLTATASDNGLIYIAGGCDSAFGKEYLVESNTFLCRSVSNSFYAFNPETQQFTTLPNMPEARHRHAAVAVNNQIWVVGGRDVYDRVVRSVNVYDINDQRWRTFNDLYEKFWVSDLGGFEYSGKAYFLGGFSHDYYAQGRVFSIDPVRSWETGTLAVVRHQNLWQRRGDVGVTIDQENQVAYVSGGSTHENDFCNSLSSVEKYDLANGVWEEIAPLHQARAGKAMVELNEQIIALGGGQQITKFCNGTAVSASGMQQPVYDVEMYENGEWNVVDSIHDYHFRSASVVHNNKIYSFGGQSSYFQACLCHPAVDEILIYDLNEMESSHHYDSGFCTTLKDESNAEPYDSTESYATTESYDNGQHHTDFYQHADNELAHSDESEFVAYQDEDSKGGFGGYKREPVGNAKSGSTSTWKPAAYLTGLAVATTFITLL